MLSDQMLLEKVKSLGLNSYEAKIWTALLSKGVATSGELSDIAKVPRSRSYDVLESLEAKGFVVMKLGKPIKYIAVPPTDIIERLKSKIKQDTEQRAKMLDEFKTTDLFSELTVLHDKGIESVDPSDLSGILKGRRQIYQKIQELLSNAEDEVILVVSAEEMNKNKRQILSGSRKNGNKSKITIYSNSKKEEFDKQIADVAEIRSTSSKSRFVVSDRKELIFMLMDANDVHPNYDSAVWVKSPFFAKALAAMITLAKA